MRDPKAPAPEPVEETWEEDPTAQDVVHLEDGAQLTKFLAEEKKPVLIMFYAPCKLVGAWFSSIDWLIDWPNELSLEWLIDWLVDTFGTWLIDCWSCCFLFRKP